MARSRLTVGEQMVRRLAERELTRDDLCRILGVTPGAVSRWISGQRTPTMRMAFRIRRELGIPVEAWLEARAS